VSVRRSLRQDIEFHVVSFSRGLRQVVTNPGPPLNASTRPRTSAVDRKPAIVSRGF
jgi:hypothetical protein